MREKTLHYGYAYLFSPIELRKIGRASGLRPVFFASSIAPPTMSGCPATRPCPVGRRAGVRLHRALGYLGRRVGYAFEKPIR